MQRTRLTSALCALLTVLAAPSALAEDGKTYPGAFCESSLGYASNLYFTGEGVYNSSATGTAVLVCPTIKDHVLVSTGISEGAVHYCNPNTVNGVMGLLVSYSRFGTSLASVTRNGPPAPSSTSANCGTLTFPALSGVSQGYYAYYVYLPLAQTPQRRARITSYRITEND